MELRDRIARVLLISGGYSERLIGQLFDDEQTRFGAQVLDGARRNADAVIEDLELTMERSYGADTTTSVRRWVTAWENEEETT
jgi:hypothetical protein